MNRHERRELDRILRSKRGFLVTSVGRDDSASGTTSRRTRTRTEIDSDIIAACARLGELAMAAQIGMQPPDRQAIGSIAEGLRRLLIEGGTE